MSSGATMNPWLRCLIALFIVGHGSIYLNFGLGRPPDALEDWRGTSWLLKSVLSGDKLKSLAFGLSIAAGLAIMACGVAVALTGSLHGLWRPLAIIGATLGLAVFAAFWDGQPQQLVNQGAIGVVVSAALFLAAVMFPRVFG